jgi:hypothetical protein
MPKPGQAWQGMKGIFKKECIANSLVPSVVISHDILNSFTYRIEDFANNKIPEDEKQIYTW